MTRRRVGGASTYYKHATARDLAGAVQARVLAATALPDFGSVGSFNYFPRRALTWMPSVLVEQAFLSNPEEEAKLPDPALRATIAKAISAGLEDNLGTWRNYRHDAGAVGRHD